MRFFLELSYNGTAYHGWQKQPNAISVQEVVEKALSTILQHIIPIVGAGRTDAGVHAKQLFAHFDTELEFDTVDLKYKLNSLLPEDIAVNSIFEVKPEVHARFHATSREYLYRISLRKDVFNYADTYQLKRDLNIKAMKKATAILFDYVDFQCFSKSSTEVHTFNCDIIDAHWHIKDDELQFTIKANRFLRNMVRAIVGTLLNIGSGKLDVDDMHTILKSKNRSEAGFSVPAHALYLVEVNYPNDIKK